MARSSDPKKLALWRDRFQRFLASGLAVARFCAVEQVSESSFYYWQKKLGPQGLRRLAGAKDRGVRDGYAGAKDRDIAAENYDTRIDDAEGRGVFQPVTVVPARCGVVVRLPGGTRIEVDADQIDAIRAVVAETVRCDLGQPTGQPPGQPPAQPTSRAGDRSTSSDSQFIRNRGGTVSC